MTLWIWTAVFCFRDRLLRLLKYEQKNDEIYLQFSSIFYEKIKDFTIKHKNKHSHNKNQWCNKIPPVMHGAVNPQIYITFIGVIPTTAPEYFLCTFSVICWTVPNIKTTYYSKLMQLNFMFQLGKEESEVEAALEKHDQMRQKWKHLVNATVEVSVFISIFQILRIILKFLIGEKSKIQFFLILVKIS